MKKFTILLATIAALFSASLFTSCSEPESNEPESNEPTIVGTWVYEESEEDWTEKVIFVFNENGSGSLTIQEIEGSTSFQESISFEYVYHAEAATLTLIIDIYYDSDLVDDLLCWDRIDVHITSNKLMLRFWYEEEIETLMVFTREK